MATLYSPTGDKYETNDKSEITRLKNAHGYSDTKPTPTAVKVATGEKAPTDKHPA
jgi:hypothetical protein